MYGCHKTYLTVETTISPVLNCDSGNLILVHTTRLVCVQICRIYHDDQILCWAARLGFVENVVHLMS